MTDSLVSAQWLAAQRSDGLIVLDIRSAVDGGGAAAYEQAQMGTLIGPAVPYGEVADVVEDIVEAYLALRDSREELFIDTVKRLGVEPFKERVYATR